MRQDKAAAHAPRLLCFATDWCLPRVQCAHLLPRIPSESVFVSRACLEHVIIIFQGQGSVAVSKFSWWWHEPEPILLVPIETAMAHAGNGYIPYFCPYVGNMPMYEGQWPPGDSRRKTDRFGMSGKKGGGWVFCKHPWATRPTCFWQTCTGKPADERKNTCLFLQNQSFLYLLLYAMYFEVVSKSSGYCFSYFNAVRITISEDLSTFFTTKSFAYSNHSTLLKYTGDVPGEALWTIQINDPIQSLSIRNWTSWSFRKTSRLIGNLALL